jgi:predicted Zn-dependent protease with MMP-like domain
MSGCSGSRAYGTARPGVVCDSLSMPYHVSADEFERLAADALESIPPDLRVRMEADNLMITIQPDATEDDRGRGIDTRVLGYFQGTNESTFSPSGYPKRIVLLQHHIERWSRTREELVDQVNDTVLHEVAHYFGMSHDDIDQTRLRH